jgi:O-antigen/teichoic acid export membrane protein
MGFLYGSQYDAATGAFQALIWLVAFTLLSSHYMYTLIAYSKQWLELLSAIFGAVINIVLNYVFILHMGFIGAAFGVLLSEASIWALNYYFVQHQITSVPFVNHLIRPIIAGTVMVILISLVLPLHFIIAGIAALLMYGAGMVILQPSIIGEVRVLIAGNR